MEREWEFEAPGDPTLSADLDTCTEALALLDEVIMYTFQQCVYHLTKTLYSLLPALLDTNPFSLLPQGQKKKTKKKKKRERVTEKEGEKEESKSEEVERSGEGEERVEEEQEEGEGEGEEKEEEEGEGGEEEGDETSLPPTVARLVDVYRQSLALCQEAQLSPPLTSQTFGYLFFFTNTSLLNTLLERGCRPEGMFSWSRAVQIRTNLDLVLDWLQGAGLGDIASEFLRKLSITVNFLCIPKTRLIQSSWSSLLEDHPLLSPAQLNHLLKHYRLGPARATPTAWTPPPDTDLSTDIFESFLDHPPLILPNETPRLDLSEPIPSPELQKEVTRIRSFIWGLDQDELPANQRTRL
ncbi:RAIN protein, partial [Amia calva]|nr:RAIN protein [Amia calva]